MEEIIKQSLGIDCAKDNFVVTFSVCDSHREIQHLSFRVFNNDELGYKAFNKWAGKLFKRTIPLIYVMESTGVYHERLAHFLYDLGKQVSVVLPKRAKDFTKTLKIKKVTDKIASQSLATMGLEKNLDLWNKPDKVYAYLKKLCREKDRIQDQIVQLKNQIHAEMSCAWPGKSTLQRLSKALDLLKKQKADVLKEVKGIVTDNMELNGKVKNITTIPGVGLLTAATVIGETDGFNHIRNKRQLVSYAGYDIMNQESGTSIKTKGRISKRGNTHIRKAMHMPALSAIRKEGNHKDLFIRLVSRSGIKMKGVVAVQRKLLVLIYILWKNNSVFDPEYGIEKKEGSPKLPHELDQVRSL